MFHAYVIVILIMLDEVLVSGVLCITIEPPDVWDFLHLFRVSSHCYIAPVYTADTAKEDNESSSCFSLSLLNKHLRGAASMSVAKVLSISFLLTLPFRERSASHTNREMHITRNQQCRVGLQLPSEPSPFLSRVITQSTFAEHRENHYMLDRRWAVT